jgi:hypothetical protein
MRPLPVTAAFTHALNSTIRNLSFAWYASWPWLAVLLPILIVGNIYVFTKTGGDPARLDAASATTGLIMAFMEALAFASIAVNWHRYVLLDEVPQGAQRLRLDDTAWRYFGNMLVIFLIIFGLGFAATFVLALLGLALGTAVVIVTSVALAALAFIGLSVFYRLGIKLPAVALGRGGFGFRDAWRVTAGNGWRILGLALLYLATALIAAVPVWLVSAAFEFLGGIVALALIVAVRTLASWLFTILGMTLLTSLYGFFVEGRDF